MTMKLYMHPVSTASRPVRLLTHQHNLPVTEVVVDLMKGEHHQPPYATLNPNRLVPLLEDGDLRLTESATIMRYLAAKHELDVYPKDLVARAKVDEALDWFNTQFYRELGYNLIYPQIFPHHKRADDTVHAGVIAWGKDKTAAWLSVLDQHWIGSKPYITGDKITIADYFGVSLTSIGEYIKCDFSKFKNVERWMNSVKQLKGWNEVNDVFNGFVGMLKDKSFEAV